MTEELTSYILEGGITMSIKPTYFAFDLKQHTSYLPSLIKCYRAAFATDPWDEWKKCSKCGKEWGISAEPELAMHNFMHCGQVVEDSWPVEMVKNSLESELTADSTCWVAVTTGAMVIGFAWGYAATPQQLEDKLHAPGFADIFFNDYPDVATVAYQDDIGVHPGFRLQGIALELIDLRLRDFKRKGLSVGVARVMRNPPSGTYAMYDKHGFKTVYQYNDSRQRVIMTKPYKGYYPKEYHP